MLIDRFILSLLVVLIVAVIGLDQWTTYALDHTQVSACQDWLCQLAERK